MVLSTVLYVETSLLFLWIYDS